MSFGIALSGIDAAQSALDTVSNNIANSQTTGFKQSDTQFAELFSASAGGTSADQIGEGVQLAAVSQDFSQGNITTTGNSLNLAISGQGFFTLNDGGSTVYSRNGDFSTDANGNVVNSADQILQVYPPNPDGTFNTSTLTNLNVNTTSSAPLATTNLALGINLPSGATPPTNATFSPTAANSYNNSTTATVYDSLGAVHTASVYFVQTATPNTWNAYLTVDGVVDGGPQTLTYSPAGVLTTPANGQVTFPAYQPTTGANPMNLTVNFGQSTQYGNAFAVNSITQNGYTTGQLSGVNVSTTGVVQAQFTNGQSVALGQVALANFADPDGLEQLGNTDWAETATSGQALQGQAGSSSLGLIQAGSLEESNVDVTAQLVNMITAQRAFQANAEVITTQDQMTQTVIGITTNG
jgi:flagellar hook protein FlgE